MKLPFTTDEPLSVTFIAIGGVQLDLTWALTDDV